MTHIPLHLVQDDVAHHMDSILKNFKDGAKITVIVRIPWDAEADFMMTNDTIDEIREVLARREKAGEA